MRDWGYNLTYRVPPCMKRYFFSFFPSVLETAPQQATGVAISGSVFPAAPVVPQFFRSWNWLGVLGVTGVH